MNWININWDTNYNILISLGSPSVGGAYQAGLPTSDKVHFINSRYKLNLFGSVAGDVWNKALGFLVMYDYIKGRTWARRMRIPS